MANLKVSKFSRQIEELLDQLSEVELISLAKTVTGGLLKSKINSRPDAVKAIICYSGDVVSILRRKIFTREKLLSYLYERNIDVTLPITKVEIINRILNLWNCTETIKDSLEVSSLNNESAQEEKPKHHVLNTYSCSEEVEQCSSNEPSKDLSVINSSLDISDHKSLDIESQKTINLLAQQFSTWFFKLLNDDQLSPDHFFPDATLNLSVNMNSCSVSNNSSEIVNCLTCTKNQYNLFFNPNVSSRGIEGKMNPHGLVMVLVCGTLHSKNVCVGVFEQMFALARDPFAENNWKIKRTDLKLKSGDSNSDPELCDSNINNPSNSMTIKE